MNIYKMQLGKFTDLKCRFGPNGNWSMNMDRHGVNEPINMRHLNGESLVKLYGDRHYDLVTIFF